MSHSFYSADRSTHLKVAVIGLVAGIARAGFGSLSRACYSAWGLTLDRRPVGPSPRTAIY
jgi:hypothetical protein